MNIGLNKLWDMFGSGDCDEIVQVKVGDLKRLINEKNTYLERISEKEVVISELTHITESLGREITTLERTIEEQKSAMVENSIIKAQVKELEEKIDIASALIKSKNNRLKIAGIEKPIMVNLYA